MVFNIASTLKKFEELVLRQSAVFSVGFVGVLEIFSLLVYLFPIFALPVCVVLFVLVAVSTVVAPHIAISGIIVELVYGAFGRMMSVSGISLRMVLYLGFMVGYGVRYARTRENFPTKIHYRYATMILIIATGIGVGLYRGNDVGRIFSDVNAFFFIPLLLLARRHIARHLSHYITLLFTTIFIFCVKTLLVFWYFAGGTPVVGNSVYIYLRDTRVFEVTAVTGEVSRIFSSASFFLAIPFLYILSKRFTVSSFVAGSLLSAVLLVGFSRSLLVGIFCAVAYLIVSDWKVLLRGVGLAGAGFLVVVTLLFTTSFHGNYFELWYGRTRNIASEVAAVSRFEQVGPLWRAYYERHNFGHGFGATLAIETPQSRADGVVVRSAFEWGYLDAMFKLGILGIILSMLVYELSRGGNTKTARAISLTVVVTHFFTPLLFHPIGMGMLVVASLLNVKSIHEITRTDEVFSFDLEPIK